MFIVKNLYILIIVQALLLLPAHGFCAGGEYFESATLAPRLTIDNIKPLAGDIYSIHSEFAENGVPFVLPAIEAPNAETGILSNQAGSSVFSVVLTVALGSILGTFLVLLGKRAELGLVNFGLQAGDLFAAMKELPDSGVEWVFAGGMVAMALGLFFKNRVRRERYIPQRIIVPDIDQASLAVNNALYDLDVVEALSRVPAFPDVTELKFQRVIITLEKSLSGFAATNKIKIREKLQSILNKSSSWLSSSTINYAEKFIRRIDADLERDAAFRAINNQNGFTVVGVLATIFGMMAMSFMVLLGVHADISLENFGLDARNVLFAISEFQYVILPALFLTAGAIAANILYNGRVKKEIIMPKAVSPVDPLAPSDTVLIGTVRSFSLKSKSELSNPNIILPLQRAIILLGSSELNYENKSSLSNALRDLLIAGEGSLDTFTQNSINQLRARQQIGPVITPSNTRRPVRTPGSTVGSRPLTPFTSGAQSISSSVIFQQSI